MKRQEINLFVMKLKIVEDEGCNTPPSSSPVMRIKTNKNEDELADGADNLKKHCGVESPSPQHKKSDTGFMTVNWTSLSNHTPEVAGFPQRLRISCLVHSFTISELLPE